MPEKLFNLFRFVTDDIIRQIGAGRHERGGGDAEKLAFLQLQVTADFPNAKCYVSTSPLLGETMSRFLVLSLGTLSVFASSGLAQTKYVDYQDAYNQGANHIRAGRLAQACEPLEAAADLASTAKEKLEVRRALLVPYRELQAIEPMQTAGEYILTNSDQAAEQSLTRSTMLAFFNKRGKLADAIKGYEERLKKSPDDHVVLFVLTEAYGRYRNKPDLSADAGEKLIAVEEKQRIKPYVISHAEIARQMVLAKRYKAGAKLFEKLAPLDKTMEAWNYKEAAQAWLKAGDKAKALAAAKKSSEATPEKRSGQLAYYWQRALGETFMSLDEPKAAVGHFEQALKLTTIDGYVKDTRGLLAEAKAAAGK